MTVITINFCPFFGTNRKACQCTLRREVVNKQLTREHAKLLLVRQPKIKNVNLTSTTFVGKVFGVEKLNDVLEQLFGEIITCKGLFSLQNNDFWILSRLRPWTSADFRKKYLSSQLIQHSKLLFSSYFSHFSSHELLLNDVEKIFHYLCVSIYPLEASTSVFNDVDKVENEVFSVSGLGLELVSNNVQLKLEIMLVVLSAPGKFNEVKDRLQFQSQSQSQCGLHSGWVMKEKTYLNPYIKCMLQLCGDVEVHPGPRQSPQPDGAREGDHHDRQDPHVGHDKQPMSTNMGCDLQVTSLNVRGLSDAKKVRHLVNSCYKLCRSSKNSIFLLQETFVPMLKLLDYLW